MAPISCKISLLLLLLLLLQSPARAARRQKQTQLAEPEPNSYVEEPMAMVASQQVQCEPISIKMCAHMPYELTRMPNFFGDENQHDAKDRALQYGELVASQCSPGLLAYVCELLAPVCLPESQREAMKRFDIYPCRSWCRRVRRDCDLQLDQLSQLLFKPGSSRMPLGFSCDQLPFESNGGNGTNQGPCHDLSDQALSQQQPKQSNNYSPYQQYLDTNNPPYITDTSKIDPKYVRPPPSVQLDEPPPGSGLPGAQDSKQVDSAAPKTAPPNNRQSGQQQQQTLAGHLYNGGQTLIWALTRYSNWLSFATVLLLLVALNSRRLSQMAKCRAAGSSKSSSASSSSSRHHLHRPGGGQVVSNGSSYPPLGVSHSPSSSSRSLMLIAGSGKQAASHQLLPAGAPESVQSSLEPSQKLLQALNQANNSTMINPHQQPLSGTLGRFAAAAAPERSQHHKYFMSATKSQAAYDERQQLFTGGTLDSQSSQSNQYDYIQLPGQQQQQSQQRHTPSSAAQLYSNILLSSPSHQVLLFNNDDQPGQSIPSRPCFQQNRSNRQSPYFSASMSPYAASSLSGGYLVNEHQRSLQRRHRKHQLVIDSSLSSGSSGSAGNGGPVRRPL